MSASVQALLAQSRKTLLAAGVETAALDARLLLGAALDADPALLPARGSEPVGIAAMMRFHDWTDRRAAGEPVHRILGWRDFYSRRFELAADCLEPRPETELLVERVLEDWPVDATARFADIGCGSGAIVLTLLAERPGLEARATDIAEGAIAMTGRNAERLGVADRLVAKRTSVLAGVAGPFDFIVSNPPYIPSGDIAGLSREVREHDPVAALDGGEDGLAVYRAILDQAPMHLKPGGLVYLETGHDQHAALRGLAAARGFGFVSASRDLAGLERILVLRRA